MRILYYLLYGVWITIDEKWYRFYPNLSIDKDIDACRIFGIPFYVEWL